jgi:hypothetical protein
MIATVAIAMIILRLPTGDPFPVQRIIIPREEWPAVAKRQTVALTAIPADDFERLMRTNRLLERPAVAAAEAHHTATWTPQGLRGRSTLIPNPTDRPCHIDLGNPSFAVTACTNEHGVPHSPTANIRGSFSVRTVPTDRTVNVEWTARSNEPNRYALTLPPSRVTEFSLSLPPGWRPIWDDGIVVASESDSTSLVHVRSDRPLVFSVVPTVAVPSGVARFDSACRLDLDGPRPRVRHRIDWSGLPSTSRFGFDTPANTTVIGASTSPGVTLRCPRGDRVEWSYQGPSVPGFIEIETDATIPDDRPFTLPRLRIDGAVRGRESYSVMTSRDRTVWLVDAGDFRPTAADRSARGESIVEFAAVPVAAGAVERRAPVVRIERARPRITIVERAQYSAESGRERWRVQAVYTVERGPLRELTFAAPEGFRLVEDDLARTEAHAEWMPVQGSQYGIRWLRARPSDATGAIRMTFERPLPDRPADRQPVPVIRWEGVERSGNASVVAGAGFDPIPPLVVAYQDLGPDAVVPLVRSVVPIATTPPPAVSIPLPVATETRFELADDAIRAIRSGSNPKVRNIERWPGSTIDSIRIDGRAVARSAVSPKSVTIPTGDFELTESFPRRPGILRFVDPVTVGPADRAIRMAGATWVVRSSWIEAAAVLLAATAVVVALRSRRRLRGLATVAIAVAMAVPARTESPRRTPVYFVADGKGSWTVHLPVSLKLQLETFADRLRGDLVRAEYSATAAGDSCRWSATWTFDARQGDRLDIPLATAKVESVTLDDRPAFPLPFPGGGFSLVTERSGLVRVRADFTTTIADAGIERTTTLLGPEVPLRTVAIRCDDPAWAVDLESARGIAVHDASKRTTTIDAGSGAALSLRWSPVGPRPRPDAEPARQISVWDLHDHGAEITTAFQLPAVAEVDPTFTLAIPDALAFHRIVAARHDGKALVTSVTMIDPNRCTIKLHGPVNGRATAIVSCLRRFPMTAEPVLPIPTLVDRGDPQPIVALRRNEVLLASLGQSDSTAITLESVTKAAAAFPELEFAANPPDYAFRANRLPQSFSAVLAGGAPVSHSQSWRLGTDSRVTGEIEIPRTTPTFLRLAIPPGLRVVAVRGPDLLESWIDADSIRIVVRGRDEPTTVRWVGELTAATANDRTLPIVRGPGLAEPTVTAEAADGWKIVRPLPATTETGASATTATVERVVR